MSICTSKKHCRLCSSTALEMVLDLGQSPIGEDFILPEQQQKEQPVFPVTLMRCSVCGHVQLGQVVDKSSMYTEYLYETTRSLGLDRHFEAYADTLLNLPFVLPGQCVVDIGSNTGTLLHALQQRGMRVQGVEPAQRLASNATAAGVPTECCYFDRVFAERFCSAHGQASIVAANNVFANIDDLDAFMEAVKILLSPEGYFVVETGYAVDLVQNFVIDNVYHEHLSYFSLHPLVRYFAQKGLRIVRVDRIPTKGGSIRVYARHIECNEEMGWSVEGLLCLESELMFTYMTPYISFAKAASARREQTRQLIQERAGCGSMAAFGASVGGTALLHWLDIAEHIEFIVDDNPIMHGRLSPHHHIMVLPPSALCSRKPVTLLNLPWRYLQPILQRHQAYFSMGGRMIQPLPFSVLV